MRSRHFCDDDQNIGPLQLRRVVQKIRGAIGIRRFRFELDELWVHFLDFGRLIEALWHETPKGRELRESNKA
jgi:hypothetical protein